MTEENASSEAEVEEVKKEPSVAFLIIHDGGYANVKLTGFTSLEAAKEAAREFFPISNTLVVQEPKDLEDLEIAQLVALYNSINDASLSRFRTLENGRERLIASINGIINSTSEAGASEGKNMATKKKTAAKKPAKAPKEPGEKKKRKNAVNAEKKIQHTDKFKEVKLREGSARAEDFSKMKNNLKVSTYLENGGSASNIRYGLLKGLIKLVD